MTEKGRITQEKYQVQREALQLHSECTVRALRPPGRDTQQADTGKEMGEICGNQLMSAMQTTRHD